jgi:hypothetical protein
MKKINYSRYFRFTKFDTVVTEISTNDFKPLKIRPFKKNWLIGNARVILRPIADTKYSLIASELQIYAYRSRTRAMEMAKAGALEYMETLIEKGREGMAALLKYRNDHYEDLNQNLTYANIEAIKTQMQIS